MKGISNESRRALAEVLKYTLMTEVQAQTLPFVLAGEDVLAKAKTGTGKTLGFLIPIVEMILKARAKGFGRNGDVGALILSPTRELAAQISREAASLLHFHRDIGVQVVIGGVNMKSQLKRMNTQRLDIMVATPGRLIDHLENSPGVLNRLKNMRVRVAPHAPHPFPLRKSCAAPDLDYHHPFCRCDCPWYRCSVWTSATRCWRWVSARS